MIKQNSTTNDLAALVKTKLKKAKNNYPELSQEILNRLFEVLFFTSLKTCAAVGVPAAAVWSPFAAVGVLLPRPGVFTSRFAVVAVRLMSYCRRLVSGQRPKKPEKVG